MLKRNLYLGFCLVIFCGPVNALNDIDHYVMSHCMSACNGESPDCQDCYNEAIDLHDQQNPVSPEYNFDVIRNHNGKLELTF